MRILITSAHSLEGETGSALIAEILAKQLSNKEDVLYLKLGKEFGISKLSKHLTLLTIPSSNLDGVFIPRLTPGVISKIRKELDKFKPDVIHAQNIISASLVALIWAKERNIPFVITLHAPPHQDLTYVYPHLEKNKILKIIDRAFTLTYNKTIIKNATLVIALNNVITDSLKIISPSTKTTMIDNGIQLKNFRKLTINKPGKSVGFIFPGSYFDRKNQRYLINVFRYLPKNYILNLYGLKVTGGNYLKSLESSLKRYKLTNVNINDYVEGNSLIKAYNSASYFISASIREVQSLAIIEALAAGKPIIALENETTKDVIQNKNCLILPQLTDAKTFAKRLLIYVKNTNENYAEISRLCRKDSPRFDIQNISEKTRTAYQEAIRINKRPQYTNKFLLKIFLMFSILIGLGGSLLENIKSSQFSRR